MFLGKIRVFLGVLAVSTLRVATLNIWNKGGPWLSRLPLIRREIARLDPKILGLQEVLRFLPEGLEHMQPSPQNDQASEIADGLGFHVAFAEANDWGRGLKFGNALLSRYPIVEERRFVLPGIESGEQRALLYTLCDTPSGPLPVFVTHLNWKLHHGSVRQRQVAYIVERIDELAPPDDKTLPAVLVGDFNAAPDADEIRYLTGLHAIDGKTAYLADAWAYAGSGPGYTFDRENDYARKAREPSRRIDYIFTRGPDRQFRGEALSADLAFHKASAEFAEPVWPSDHFGVVADITVEPRSL
ncbi:MAG TPA: endonuclease/exonuclease/phosphatase family protein [Polyangiaceae bacterium]